jgi:hypothetical protein
MTNVIRAECEMEPETTTELVCPNNLPESPLGNCIVGTTSISNAICPNSHPFLHLDGKCRNAEGEIGDLDYQCQPGQEFDDSDLPNNPRCFVVIPKVEQEVQEPCPDGSTLDETRNLCVTKPGRNSNNRN